MEVGKGKRIYISEGNQNFVSDYRSISKLKIYTASSTEIQISPCRNKVASNGFLLVKIMSLFLFCFSIYGVEIFLTEKSFPTF